MSRKPPGDAVASGEIPGVVILIGQGQETLLHRAWGWRTLVPEPRLMSIDTVFDVASLTKPLGTTLAVMALVERGAIQLDAPLGRYLKEFRGRAFQHVTIERILTHSAGFAAIPPELRPWPMASRPRPAPWPSVPLEYPPGGGFQYSDTGFILLGEVVRRVSGQPLDRYLERILFRPLGLRDTTFHPGESLRGRVAPTEFFGGSLLVGGCTTSARGLLGGVAGHAGIFSTSSDLARICRMLLNGGELDGQRILKPATVRQMWSRSAEVDGSRALGWDISSSFSRTMAPFFPPGAVGHTGFTGTAVSIDPTSQTYMIMLTNRVHPTGGGATAIRDLRVRVSAAIGGSMFRTSTAETTEAAGDRRRRRRPRPGARERGRSHGRSGGPGGVRTGPRRAGRAPDSCPSAATPWGS